MKNISFLSAVILSSTVCFGAYAQVSGSESKNDTANTYKYLKDSSGNCVSSTAVNLGCTDLSGHAVTQFKTVSGFSSSQYGQSEYSITFDLDGDGSSGIDVDNDGNNDKISKYSSSLGFGSHKHAPVAIERPASAGSSQSYIYFVYSGPVTLDGTSTIASTAGQGNRSTSSAFHFATNKSPVLGIYVSKFNPLTNKATKPVLVHAKYTDDFHDNAVINMDDDGYIYVMISGRNNGRQMMLYRSNAAYSLDSFTDVTPDTPNTAHKISYPKFFWTDNGYFRLVYSDYDSAGNRDLWSAKVTPDGSGKATFSQEEPISQLHGYGHYAIGDARGNDIVLAFNEHSAGVDKRTNLYYMHSSDGGETWKNADNVNISLPLTTTSLSSVAVKEYNGFEERLIYIKDIAFETDQNGNKFPEIVVVGIVGALGTPLHQPNASYDRYFATWNRNSGNSGWLGRRFSEQVDHNYSGAALHQSSSGTSVIYAQTPQGQENYLAGGAIAKGNLTDTFHTGNVLANNVANVYFSNANYCEFNNIRPIHTDVEEGSQSVWAVATAGNPQRYVGHNPLLFVLSNGDVKQLPESSNTTSDWLDTTSISSCSY